MRFAAADRINHLNSGLMIGSCVAAYLFPFELFLVSYAVLGPLHYLTEISWLHDRGYFARAASERRGLRIDRLWLLLVAITLTVMLYGLFREKALHRNVSAFWEIALFYLVFLTASVVVFVRNPATAAAIAIAGTLLVVTLNGSRYFGLIAFFLITIIHVFIFTAAFILLGALKSRSRSGLLSLAVFAACAVSFFIYVPDVYANAAPYVRTSYTSFQTLNAELIKLFGLGNATSAGAIYETTAGLIVMRFIAFAYTYHYLNWFSKTSIIKWHEVPKTRTALILGAWIAALVPFAFSYEIGFVTLYVLSALHVMLEFPLNHQSFAGIWTALRDASRNREVLAR